MKQAVKTLLLKTGLIAGIRDIRGLMNPAIRSQRRSERARLEGLRAALDQRLRLVPPGTTRTALFVSFEGVAQIAAMAPVLTAFQLAGYEPVPIASGRVNVYREAFSLFGVDKIFYLEDLPPAPKMLARAEAELAKCREAQDLLPLEEGGISYGKFALATLLRRLRTASVDFADPKHRQIALEALTESLDAVARGLLILAKAQPDVLVFPDRGYTPEGQLYDAAIAAGIPCFTWNVAHRENAIVLKRYDQGNQQVHFSTLSEASWSRILKMPWTDDHWRQVFGELDQSYRSGQWYAEVGTQFNKVFPEREQLMLGLGLDPAKKTAVIFPHIFWDATFFWGIDVFSDYKEWFANVLQAACRNDQLNWLIKVHPAHVVKSNRDGHAGASSEEDAIAEYVGTLPRHVRLLPPDTEISTWSLFELIDYCLTVRGTVGMEGAMLGIRVLTCGTGRYDRHGFTSDYADTETYLAALANLQTMPPPSAEEIELARRYAYGIFIARPARLTSFKIEFSRDSTASLQALPLVRTVAAAQVAKDLNSIADWIRSGDEDYLDGVDITLSRHEVQTS